MANYPDTIQLGSVTEVDGYKLPKIDLLIGGSPCQSFSFAGKRKGMSTKCETEILTLEQYLELKNDRYEFEGQSYLFWEYMRLLNEVQPKYFLLENVIMADKWEKTLSRAIGVNPIEINSALVSAQNRRRLYWTNIGMKPMGLFGYPMSIIEQPKDRGILLKDILESEVDEKYFLSDKQIANIEGWNAQQNPLDGIEDTSKKAGCLTARGNEDMHSGLKLIQVIGKDGKQKRNKGKASCFTAGGNSGGNHSDMDLIVHNMQPRSGDPLKGGTGHLTRSDGKTYCLDTGNTNAVEIVGGDYRADENRFRWRNNGKSGTLLTSDNAGQFEQIAPRIRRLTPIECERLQTVKDNYTAHVSDSQRYKMLGNGWTVDVIAHIFFYIDK